MNVSDLAARGRVRVPTVVGAPTEWVWWVLGAGLVLFIVVRAVLRRRRAAELAARVAEAERLTAEYRARRANRAEPD